MAVVNPIITRSLLDEPRPVCFPDNEAFHFLCEDKEEWATKPLLVPLC